MSKLLNIKSHALLLQNIRLIDPLKYSILLLLTVILLQEMRNVADDVLLGDVKPLFYTSQRGYLLKRFILQFRF